MLLFSTFLISFVLEIFSLENRLFDILNQCLNGITFIFSRKTRQNVFLFWVLESKIWLSVRSKKCFKVIDTIKQHHFFRIFSDWISIIRISIVSFKPVPEHSTRNYSFSFLPVTTVFVPHRKVFVGKIKLPPDYETDNN